MRSLKLFALAALLVGCGDPQPNVYKIAIDTSPLNSLPGSCYTSGTAPTTTVTTTNVVDEQTWEWWPGLEGDSYLQIGSLDGYQLGSAADISIGDTIVGQGKTFTATRTRTTTSGTPDINTQTVTVSLKNDPGGVIEGTLFLKSEHTCNANQCSFRTCEVTMNFVGRRLDVDQSSIFLDAQ